MVPGTRCVRTYILRVYTYVPEMYALPALPATVTNIQVTEVGGGEPLELHCPQELFTFVSTVSKSTNGTTSTSQFFLTIYQVPGTMVFRNFALAPNFPSKTTIWQGRIWAPWYTPMSAAKRQQFPCPPSRRLLFVTAVV